MIIQMPQNVVLHEDPKNPNKAKFVITPMERGYGHTLGNTYRRILLSSLEGYAITALKIPGIKHEFATLEGVTEDVLYIHLNLKKIRFRPIKAAVDTETVAIALQNKTIFRAGDIKSKYFEVLNPEEIICHMEPSVHLNMELVIQKGIGYIPAEDQLPPAGYLALDAIFTPIINVNITVQNARVGDRTNYDQLTLEIQTNGALSPKTAIQQATKILQNHFALFVNPQIAKPEAELGIPSNIAPSQSDQAIKQLLDTPLSHYKNELSVRVHRALDKAGITTLKELVNLSESEMEKLKNFGKKSLDEIKAFLEAQGLTLHIDLPVH